MKILFTCNANDRPLHPLIPRATGLLVGWGWEDFEMILLSEDGGHLEHLIHECAHASLLQIPFGPNMAKEINSKIHALENKGSDSLWHKHSQEALWEESKAWVIEWLVMHAIGFTPFGRHRACWDPGCLTRYASTSDGREPPTSRRRDR